MYVYNIKEQCRAFAIAAEFGPYRTLVWLHGTEPQPSSAQNFVKVPRLAALVVGTMFD